MSAASERPEAPLFSDGLGDRVVAVDGATGDLLQILRLRPQLLAVPSFEFALRERAARLANFRHAYYARVRRVDRHPGGLAIVSDHVEGTRLSDILRVAAERRLHLDLNAALCLIRQLVPALALLHENARDVAHGALSAERLIVTPHARLVVAEHVLGSAVEQLQYNRERLWQELRVAVPATAGPPRFDHRADVTAMGLVALALILGRPIRSDEHPQRLTALLSAAVAKSTLGEEQPLPPSLRTWVARALQIDPRHGFASALDAQNAFEELLAENTGFLAAPIALETFLSRYITALLEPAPVEPTADASVEPSSFAAASVDKPSFTLGPADNTADRLTVAHVTSEKAAPQASVPDKAPDTPVLADRPAANAAVESPVSNRSQYDVEALKAEFLQALAETPEPDSVQAATASLSSARVRPAKPAIKKTASIKTAADRPAAGKPPTEKAIPDKAPERSAMPPVTPAPGPIVGEAPRSVAEAARTPVVSPTARAFEAETERPASAARPIDPPDITELLKSIDASTAPVKIDPARLDPDEQRMFESEPEKTGSRWRRMLIAMIALVAIGEGAVLAARVFRKPTAPNTGTLSVQTNPPGVAVFIDGESRGNTPAHLSLKAGSHILELRGRGVPRAIPITISAGADVSQYLELPETPAVGSLLVQSDPPGAHVTIDGVERGVAPVSVADLSPGDHEVVLQAGAGAPVRQHVVIQAGVTSSVLAPVVAAKGPVSGWIAVKAPVLMEIKEGGRLLGTTDSDRLMMSAGRHEVEVVNETLGYRETKVVQVSPGKVAPLTIELPQGTLNLNASPWAEVWIDGRRIGETPIGNLPIAIGPHEILFRHPQYGERKQAVSVTMNAPVRLSVDMK